jgi:hypothetical protein
MPGPLVQCVFQQTGDLGIGAARLLQTLQTYVDDFLGPRWAAACELTESAAVPELWQLIFADNANQLGELGEHTDQGLPRGFVFVRSANRAGTPVSVVASHELAEMLVDPLCNAGVWTPRGRWAALEVCDPVQAETFEIDGVAVSDFVTPAWFGQPGDRFDYLGKCVAPWQVLAGGYIPIWTRGTWGQLFGNREAKRTFYANNFWSDGNARFKRTSRRGVGERPAATKQGLGVLA